MGVIEAIALLLRQPINLMNFYLTFKIVFHSMSLIGSKSPGHMTKPSLNLVSSHVLVLQHIQRKKIIGSC